MSNFGPLSPNSQDFMAMLEQQFSSSSSNSSTPPQNPNSNTSANPQQNPYFLANIDSYLPFTNSNPGVSTPRQSLSLAPGMTMDPPAPAKPATTQSYPQYGINTPEGSSGNTDSITSGDSPEMEVLNPVEGRRISNGPRAAALAAVKGRQGAQQQGKVVVDHKRKAEDEEEERGGRRKAAEKREVEEDMEEDSSDDEPQPKRKTGAAAAGNRRKSTGGGEKGGEMSKASKRKEQNRAAQKAFRERREQRVKDLEDKVNDLESKAHGQSVENENLRQLLTKLQQENVSLKSSAFTFSMPMPDMASVTASNNARSNSDGEQLQSLKPPSPPLSLADSRKNSGQSLRQSSMGSSPAVSTNSKSPGESPLSSVASGVVGGGAVFNPDPYNVFAGGNVGRQQAPQGGAFNAFGNATSVGDGGMSGFTSDLFSGNAASSSAQQAQFPAFSLPGFQSSATNFQQQPPVMNTPFTILAQAPDYMSFRDNTPFGNFGGFPAFNGFDYRDPSAPGASGGMEQYGEMDDNAALGMNDDLDEFLRGLGDPSDPMMMGDGAAGGMGEEMGGINQVSNNDGNIAPTSWKIDGPNGFEVGSDLFDQYWRSSNGPVQTHWNYQKNHHPESIPAPASASASASPMNAFSPSNYFMASPEASSSTSASGASGGMLTSRSSMSPGAGAGAVRGDTAKLLAVGTFGKSSCAEGEPNVVSRAGKLLSPSDMWERVQERVDFSDGFDIDDLCSQMKEKAVCGGNGPVVPESELIAAIDSYVENQKAKKNARMV